MIEIQTRYGRLRGIREGKLITFKGIPFADPPVGRFRFCAPQPITPWQGTRDALEFGPSAIQTISGWVPWVYTSPIAMGENCLTLNIWAADNPSPKPVIVWIHGGGYRTGSSSMPIFDGTKYAEHGVVMVSINYRLGILGWAAHPDLRDPVTGSFANWTVQDQIAALRWIKENIAAFGGDPDNVTVMGQSGGAINAIMIAHELKESLFHQIIAMSPPYICPPATLDMAGWELVMEDLAREFGTTVTGLRDVPALDLHNAELRQYNQRRIRTSTGRAYRGSVVDGVILKDWPPIYGLPKIPTIIGGTSMEAAYLYDFYDPVSKTLLSPPASDDDAASTLQHMMGTLYNLDDTKPTFDEVITHYRQLAHADGRTDNMVTIVMEIISDMTGQHYTVRKAEQLAMLNGDKNVYFYQYALPLMPPNAEPAHATELPITFGTFLHPHYREKIGDGELQQTVSKAMIEAFSSFAATGRPCSVQLPSWPAFREGGKNVMILGRDSKAGQVTDMPKYNRLSILDSHAALRP